MAPNRQAFFQSGLFPFEQEQLENQTLTEIDQDRKKKQQAGKSELTPSKGNLGNDSFVSSTSERMKRIILEPPATPASATINLSIDSEVSSTAEASSKKSGSYRMECSEMREAEGCSPIPSSSIGGFGFFERMYEIPSSEEMLI